jgi:hypothetical protein
MPTLSNCPYCNKDITFSDFANGNIYEITIQKKINLQENEIEDIQLHKECLDKYVEEQKLYCCNKCDYYGYRICSNLNDPTLSSEYNHIHIHDLSGNNVSLLIDRVYDSDVDYFSNNGLYYHKNCFPEYFCYDCNKDENDGLYYNFVFPEFHYWVKINDDDDNKVFHEKCAKRDVDLCYRCRYAYRRICKGCPYGKNYAYGCYNNCKFGDGDYDYCESCL